MDGWMDERRMGTDLSLKSVQQDNGFHSSLYQRTAKSRNLISRVFYNTHTDYYPAIVCC